MFSFTSSSSIPNCSYKMTTLPSQFYAGWARMKCDGTVIWASAQSKTILLKLPTGRGLCCWPAVPICPQHRRSQETVHNTQNLPLSRSPSAYAHLCQERKIPVSCSAFSCGDKHNTQSKKSLFQLAGHRLSRREDRAGTQGRILKGGTTVEAMDGSYWLALYLLSFLYSLGPPA